MEYTKFIYCETTSAFDSNKENGTITDSCIVFIKDSKQIWTHGQFFPCPYTKEQIDQMISDLESGNESSIESLREELTNFIETKGKANGIASLDKNGKVPSSQLPSYVDDVIDLKNIVAAKANIPTSGLTVGDLYFATAEKKIYKATSATAVDGGSNPESGKIYINLSNSKTYRWSGTSMAVISETLALGETSSTAYAGNKGKSTTDKVNSHVANTSNPHEVTLAQVGTITTTGSGNAVTSLSISGKTLTVTKGSTFNNYSLPLASSSTRGGIKIGYEGTGKNYAVKLDNEKAYVSVPWTDTNTHYTTRLYATTSSGTANASATNGNVYIRLFDDSTARSSLNIKGTGATTVTSNSSGVITINSTNTTYGVVDADSNGLMTPAMLVKLNGIEEDANNYVHPTSAGNKHIPSGGSEGQILRWSANGTAVWGNDNNTTYSNFKGATSSAAGSSGLVPAPSTGYQGRYLRGDGTWATPTNTTYSKATSSTFGLVKIGFPESGKNYPVELNSSGQMFVSVPWTDTNTTYSVFKAASSSAAGGTGLVPAPAAGENDEFLRGDGTWATPTNTTYSVFKAATSSAAGGSGLVPAPKAGENDEYLRGDGTWATPTNTTYSKATSSTLGLVRIGFTESGKNYPVELNDDGQMFVNVPWTDNNTTYSQATSSKLGLVKIGFPESGKNYPVELNSSGQMFVNVPWTNTTYSVATTSANGLMSSAMVTKLNGIAEGANKYTLPTASSSTLGGVKIGTGINISSGVISVKYGTAAGTAAQGNDSRLSDRRNPKTTTLTNQDLNDYRGTDYVGFYNGGGGNTVTNKPSDVNHFGLIVMMSASGYTTQILASNNQLWYRTYSTSWGSWLRIYSTDNLKNATTSTSGLMTAAMVTKLNGIQTGADAVSFSRSLSSGTKIGTITINGTGTDLYCQTNTDTHYTTHLYATTSSGTADASASNGNVYLRLFDNTTARDSINIKGTGATTVTSNSSGVITINSTNTTYAQATSSTLGLVKIGFPESGKNYPVELNSSGQMFVNVPWTDNNTTYSTMKGATSSAAGGSGLVPAPKAGENDEYLRGDGTWATPTNTDTKNTAGSTNSSSKLFLIGATSQTTSPVTYSHDTAYVGTDGCLYSGSKKVSVEGHTHNYITSRGRITAESGATEPAISGMSMSEAYSNGYPTEYGNVITLNGTGQGQLLIGWSGTNGAYAPVYVRNKRDVDSANWSSWSELYTTGNKPTPSEIGAAASNASFYIGTTKIALGRASASQTLSGVSISGNAATATKLATKRTISLTGDVTGSASFDGSANASITATVANNSHTHTISNISDLNSEWDNNLKNTASITYRSATTGSTQGWYRIAQSSSSIVNCMGLFQVTAAVSGYHTSVLIAAGISYGVTNSVQLTQLANSSYSAIAIDQVRIVYHTSYQNRYAYLEVHTAKAAAITITSRMFGDGWTALTANTAGSIPSGYTSKTLTLSTSSDIVADSFKGALSGNASTASSAAKLTTARALKIGNTSKNFDGSANVTWSLSEIGAAASSHTHSYLPLSGGTLTTSSFYGLTIKRSTANGSAIQFSNSSGALAGVGVLGDKTFAVSSGSATDGGMFKVTSGGVAYAGGTELAKINRSIYIGTTSIALNRSSASQTLNGVSISGNAGTATKLQTARTINGTSFNGSANITTANWGTSRTLKIGNTSKSVNGSANVSWSLSEIGAAAASHSHSYLPLSGGTMTGVINTDGVLGSWITGKTNAAIRFNNLAAIDTNSAWYLFNMKSSSSHVLAFGGLGNNIGFYTFLSSRTDNGTDSSFTCDTSTGNWTCNKRITASGGFSGSLSGNASSATYVTRERGSNAVTTLTSLPVSKATVTAKLSKATTISVASGLNVGESITVICTPSASFTQPIPATGSYISMDGSSLSVKSGKIFEINIYCYASGKYSISLKTQK